MCVRCPVISIFRDHRNALIETFPAIVRNCTSRAGLDVQPRDYTIVTKSRIGDVFDKHIGPGVLDHRPYLAAASVLPMRTNNYVVSWEMTTQSGHDKVQTLLIGIQRRYIYVVHATNAQGLVTLRIQCLPACQFLMQREVVRRAFWQDRQESFRLTPESGDLDLKCPVSPNHPSVRLPYAIQRKDRPLKPR